MSAATEQALARRGEPIEVAGHLGRQLYFLRASCPSPVSALQQAVPAALEHAGRVCLAKDPRHLFLIAPDSRLQLAWVATMGSQAGLGGSCPHRQGARANSCRNHRLARGRSCSSGPLVSAGAAATEVRATVLAPESTHSAPRHRKGRRARRIGLGGCSWPAATARQVCRYKLSATLMRSRCPGQGRHVLPI